MTRRHLRGLVVLIAVGALAAACGTTGPPAARSTSNPSFTPSADLVVAAVARTRGLGTARIDVEVTTRVDGRSASLRGEGAASLRKGHGDVRWTAADGSTVRELSNALGLYVQDDVPDGMWTRLPGTESTATGRLADPLRGLGTLVGPTDEGYEMVGDERATRMTGTQAASAEALALLGLDDQVVADLSSSGVGEDPLVKVTVWIDERGRVVRVDRALDVPDAPGGPVTASTSTVLSDFTTRLDLTSPPDASVTEPPPAM